jgi:thiamine-phosphate pyrophosphorylase
MVITDPESRHGLLEAATGAIRGGATAIQLRWKDASTRDMLDAGQRLRALTREAGALLLVNDRVDVALAISADGAHLGDDDLPLDAARRIVPDHFLLGRSVDTADDVRRAVAMGADYVGAGPAFATTTKRDTGPVLGVEGLARIRDASSLPVVAIGGIDAARVKEVLATGAAGVAVVAAISRAEDPEGATRSLVSALGPAPTRFR